PGPGGPRLRGPLGLPRRLPGRALLRDERGGNCAVVPGGRRAAEHHRGPGAARGAPGLPAARLRRVRPVRRAGETGPGRPGDGRGPGRPRHALQLRREPGGVRLRRAGGALPLAADAPAGGPGPVGQPARHGEAYTTITTWHNKGKDLTYRGET